MDGTLDDLADAQGGAERIKNTHDAQAVRLLPSALRTYVLPVVAIGTGVEYGLVHAVGIYAGRLHLPGVG